MASRRRSRVEGISSLRKKLRRVDPEIRKEITAVVEHGLASIAMTARVMVPVDEGDLRNSIEYQISKRDGVSGVVGPSAKVAEIMRRKAKSGASSFFGGWKYRLRKGNKAKLFEIFKGYWIEFGTKGNAALNIPPQPARPFMGPAYLVHRDRIKVSAKRAVDNVLARVARGG